MLFRSEIVETGSGSSCPPVPEGSGCITNTFTGCITGGGEYWLLYNQKDFCAEECGFTECAADGDCRMCQECVNGKCEISSSCCSNGVPPCGDNQVCCGQTASCYQPKFAIDQLNQYGCCPWNHALALQIEYVFWSSLETQTYFTTLGDAIVEDSVGCRDCQGFPIPCDNPCARRGKTIKNAIIPTIQPCKTFSFTIFYEDAVQFDNTCCFEPLVGFPFTPVWAEIDLLGQSCCSKVT